MRVDGAGPTGRLAWGWSGTVRISAPMNGPRGKPGAVTSPVRASRGSPSPSSYPGVPESRSHFSQAAHEPSQRHPLVLRQSALRIKNVWSHACWCEMRLLRSAHRSSRPNSFRPRDDDCGLRGVVSSGWRAPWCWPWPQSPGFSAFAINSRNPQIVYAASGSGVFKSTDGGASWRAASAGLTEQYVFDLAIDQHRPATLYAATESGVFKSANGGGSWHKTSMPDVDTVSLALHPRNSQVIYAGTDDDVYKSGDAGASWQKVKTARRVCTIVIDPKQPATVYAGSGGGVFKSTDAGRSWKARNVGLFPNETPDGHSLAEGFVSAIVVNSRHPQTLYLGCQRGVWKSTDGARTWRRLEAPVWAGSSPPSRDPEKPQALYAGMYKVPGLFKTTNGGRRWSRLGRPARATCSR